MGGVEVRLYNILIVSVLMILSACNESQEVSVKAESSPFFTTSTGAKMQGVERKLGLLGPEFVAGIPNKHMWHFWGTKEELRENSLPER